MALAVVAKKRRFSGIGRRLCTVSPAHASVSRPGDRLNMGSGERLFLVNRKVPGPEGRAVTMMRERWFYRG